MKLADRRNVLHDVRKWIRKLYWAGSLPTVKGCVKRVWSHLDACSTIYAPEKGVLFYEYKNKKKDKIKICIILVNPDCPDRTMAYQMLCQVVAIAKKQGISEVYMNVRDSQDSAIKEFARKYMVEQGRGMATGHKDVWYTTYSIRIDNTQEKR